MKLSVVVPVYGVERYLRQCLDSIAAQTFRDFEAILVDDGGKDACPGICDEYAASDARFKVVHKANAGYGAAVNSGLDVASGEWVGIVEPDDWLDPEMYGRLLAAASDGADIVKGNFVYIHPHGIRRRGINLGLPAGPFRIAEFPQLLTVHPSIWSCIYRRSLLQDCAIRMKEIPGAGWADNPFLYETMCRARGVAFVDFAGYFYRAPFEDPIIARSDWRIPYGRMMDILGWLKASGVEDAGVWDAAYQRVLYCAAMMLQMRRHRREVSKAVAEMLGQIDGSRINASGLLHSSTVSKYRLMKDHPRLSVWAVRLYMAAKKIKMYAQLPAERRRQEAIWNGN